MIKAAPYDSAEFLRTPRAIQHYMDEAFETGDAALIAHALGVVARANKSMSEIARKTGLAREGLYRSLSADGHPEFATIIKVLDAMGLLLRLSTKRGPARRATRVSRAKPRHKPSRSHAAKRAIHAP